MKKISSLMIAALLVPGMAAAKDSQIVKQFGSQEAPTQKPLGAMQKMRDSNLRQNLPSAMQTRQKAASSKVAPAKVTGLGDVIYQAPEGKVVPMAHSGFAYYSFWGYVFSSTYEGMVSEVVECDNGDVYVKNPISQLITNTYLKGHKDGNQVVFDLPQAIYEEEYDGDMYTYYLSLLQFSDDEGWFITTGSAEAAELGMPEIENKLVLTVGADGSYTFDAIENGDIIYGLCDEESEAWTGYGEIYGQWNEFNTEPESMPEGLTTKDVAVLADDTGHFAQMAVDGNELYLKGLFSSVPDGVLKGTIDGNTVTFTSGQYQGAYNGIYYSYINGADITQEYDEDYDEYYDVYVYKESLTLSYDAEKEMIIIPDNQALVLSASEKNIIDISALSDAKITVQPENLSVVPVNPTNLEFTEGGYTYLDFTLAPFNTDGYLIDSKNLYYKIFIDGDEFTFYPDEYEAMSEEITLVPYSFTDNWDIYVYGPEHTVYFYLEGFETIGVQEYYIEGEPTEENIKASTDLVELKLTGVKEVGAAEGKTIAEAAYYTIDGARVSNPGSGIYLKVVNYTDGTSKSFKVIKK